MSKLVAVFQIGSLGDSIVSIPTLLSLKELIPNCSEYLLITRFDTKLKVMPGDIFDMAWKPKVQLQYAGPGNRLQQLLTVPAVVAKLRYYRPSCCVSLMPADREAERVERDRRFFATCGIKDLRGFEAYPRSQFEPSVAISKESTEAYLRFKRAWGADEREKFDHYSRVPVIHPSPAAVQTVHQWLKKNRKSPAKRLLAVAPFSNFPSKDIPDKTLLAFLPELAKQADAELVMLGGSKDVERAAKLVANSETLNACGVFSVQESTALLKEVKLAICADSGPMHLAAAVGAPLLAVFSRINQQLTRWLPFGQKSTILYRDVPCAGCFAFECPVAGHPCMTQIPTEQLIIASMSLLGGARVSESDLNGTHVLRW